MEEDEEVRLGSNPGAPSIAGALRYDGTAGIFRFRDSAGTFDPRSGSGMSEAQHKALLQLIHFIDDGPAEGFASGATKATTYSGAFPTVELWRRADSTKLVEKTTTYSGAFPTTEVWKVYDDTGTVVLATISDAISYSGAFEASRTRSIS